MLHRHRHSVAFAAVVLAGRYVEAGDTGLHRAEPGDVILHRAFEGHLNRFEQTGAIVVTLPMPGHLGDGAHWRAADPDAVIRLAERDRWEAAQMLRVTLTEVETVAGDWPELLARDLLTDPGLSIRGWAGERQMHPGSVARGFRQQFGLTAATFRSNARVHRAIRDVELGSSPLAKIAATHGFADQAHMTRMIRLVARLTPTQLYGRASSGQHDLVCCA